MRLIKMLGLAAIAAMVAMAFVGASSATAAPEHPEIVLCKNAELICENAYPNPTEIHGETLAANPPKLLSSLGTVECEHSLAILTLLNKLAKLIEGHLLALDFTGNCHLGSTPCQEVKVNALGGVSVKPGEKKLTAIINATELEGRKTNATIKCGSFINCTFSASPTETELKASSDGEGHLSLESEAKLVEGKGFLCPTTSKWDALYHAVNLDAELTRKTGLYIEL